MLLKGFFVLFFLFPLISQSENLSSKESKIALNKLKVVLKKYHKQNVFMKVEKKLYLPFIKKVKKERGSFHLSRNKFRLQTQTSPKSLIVFDGKYLWYQSNLEENTVFKFQTNHPYLYLFSKIFNSDQFFKTFKVIQATKKDSVYTYNLHPIKKNKEIKKIILTAGNYIQKLDIFWEDLNNHQSYKFYKPWFKKEIAQSLFIFKEKDFKIILKD